MSFLKINSKCHNSTVTLAGIHFTWAIQLPQVMIKYYSNVCNMLVQERKSDLFRTYWSKAHYRRTYR